jgi:formate dehydrogenase subunit gamma
MRPTSGWSRELCAEILTRHAGREGALLPILHDVQAAVGFVPEAAVADIAHGLNLTRAEVHGTVSFYHDFRTGPAGRRVIKLCQAEACQARGGRAVTAAVEDRLGARLGGTSAGGEVTLEAVYCLGLCASGPSAMVDGRPVARLAPDALEALFDETAA